jgi:Domain of unknown function (DUF4293)
VLLVEIVSCRKFTKMIQRKQSIWLLLASLSILLTMYIPYGTHLTGLTESGIIAQTDLTARMSFPLLCLTILSVSFSFFTIFLYGNRNRQTKFCLLSVLIALSVLGFQLVDASQSIGNKLVVGIFGSTLYMGVFMPILSVVFIMMAYAGIKKDEKLIRDSDRLR